MPVFSRISSFVSHLFHRRAADQRLDEEVDSYLRMLIDDKIAAGSSAEEARRLALLEMEGLTQVKEKTREARSTALIHSLLQDLRYGSRFLLRRKSFTLFALLTLAIGIGINTAIFSVVNVVLLEPLPYAESNRLAIIWSVFKSAGLSRAPASGHALAEMRTRSRLFQDFGGIWVGSGSLLGEGEPEQIRLGEVTWNFFSVLGARPAMGRLFLPQEEGHGAATVILSDGLWRRRYGADPRIVGSTIRTAGGTLTVAGVMPPDFELIFPPDASVPANIQAWIPFPFPIEKGPRDLNFIRVIGRVRPNVPLPQAQAELDNIAGQLRSEFHEYSEQDLNLQALPLHGDAVNEVRPALLALFGGVGLVLLIACANVANLLLARACERTREMTMRRALGASRLRIVRQLLTESFLLSFLGGAAGLGVARLLLKSLPALWPNALPRINAVALDLPTLLFTSALCLLTGLIFGLAPAVGSSSVHLLDALKDSARIAGSARIKLRRLLILGEVALAFMLLIGAGLMIRTFVGLLKVDPGFDSANVLTFAVSLPEARYRDDGKRNEFLRRLESDLSVLPGVKQVGAVSHIPFDDFPNWYSYYWPEGASKEQQTTLMADHRSISPGFFSAFNVPLLSGRPFNEMDDAKHPRVAVIDDQLAAQLWPGANAIGKKLNVETITDGDFNRGWTEIVGVVKHVNYQSLMQAGRPQVYLPSAQSPRPQMQMAFALRTAGPVEQLVLPIRGAVAALDKDLPISKLRPLESYVAQARTRTRFTTLLSGLLAMIALLLACIGIYGVTAYSVAQSTNEIGVRMALGAQRGDIVRMVLRRSMWAIAGGIVLGGLGALAVSPLLASILFQVKATDMLTFVVVAVLLCAIGFLACYVPASRASRVDPVIALRYE